MKLAPVFPLWHSFGQPDPAVSRQDWLTGQLRAAIVAGTLAPGARLPASRQLASDIALSRNTVSIAYERLIAEGLLDTRPGAGTFVATSLSRSEQQTATVAIQEQSSAILSARAAQLLPTPGERPPADDRLPLTPGLPDPDLFPHDVWARLSARVWRRQPTLGYGDAAGLPVLREAVAGYIGATRGVACEADQILITAGTQGAMAAVTLALLEPGAQAWVEDPGYRQASRSLRLAGATPVGVSLDEEGLNVQQGITRAPEAMMAIVSPSHQYPLGTTMSLARRIELLDWAGQRGAWIFEDDYDGEYRYDGAQVKALKSLDRDGRVIYGGTFSKLLAPGLRLGFIVVPDALIDALRSVRQALDHGIATPIQAALADFIGNGHLGTHIRKTRAVYDERRQQVRAACEQMPSFVGVKGADAGLHLVGLLDQVDDQRVVARARAAGLGVSALSTYRQPTGQPNRETRVTSGPASRMGSGVLIGYATPGSGPARLTIPQALEKFAAAVKSP
ncbi:MAG: PLP-dependent aminotransferase family protein [Burkholderiaceae bacterium]